MEFPLKYATLFPEVWKALGKIPRTGWVDRKVKNPETVQEHTVSCRNLVIDLIDILTEFSMSDIIDILNMLEVHDWAESIIGDEVIVTYDEEEKVKLKASKFEREYKAMRKITSNGVNSLGSQVLMLWTHFEKSEDRLSLFARQIDKYQSIEKGWVYQQKGENVVVQDFINYYRNDIVHPLLKERTLKIEKLANDTRN